MSYLSITFSDDTVYNTIELTGISASSSNDVEHISVVNDDILEEFILRPITDELKDKIITKVEWKIKDKVIYALEGELIRYAWSLFESPSGNLQENLTFNYYEKGV